MGVLDRFLGLFGYEKAQMKPGNFTSMFGYERDKILEPEKLQNDVSNQEIKGYPENISKDTQDTPKSKNKLNEFEIEKRDKEELKTNFPYDSGNTDLNTLHNIPQDNPNLKQIKPRPILDIEEITKLNRNIAMKMERLGISYVDEEIFMRQYKSLLKEAALQRKPISEILDAFF